MEFLDTMRDYIRNAEDSDLYKYFAIFFGVLLVLLSLLVYFHYNRVSTYHQELKRVDTLRTQTKKILRDYKVVNAQKQHIEEVLAQNKNFRIGEAYQTIIQRAGLSMKLQDQSRPSSGELVGGKTEVTVSSHFSGLTMKQVTDLLSEIAQIPQLFTKELTIKKIPQASVVDLDITVATLEQSSIE